MKNLQRNTFGLIAITYCLGMVYQLFLVTHFQVNQEEITKVYCVNKDKPEMHCNGKCHLKKELKKTTVHSKTIEEDSNTFTPSLYFMPFCQNLMYSDFIDSIDSENSPNNHINSRLQKNYLDTSLPPPQVVY